VGVYLLYNNGSLDLWTHDHEDIVVSDLNKLYDEDYSKIICMF